MGTPKGDVRRRRGATSSGRATASSVEPRLRSARPEDSPVLAGLLGELGYPSTPEQAAERVERIADDPTTWLVVAELDGEVAGFGVLHVQNLVERDEPGVEVAGLVVAEHFRRRGVGALLMKALEDQARARGGTTMVLNTAHSRADAHAFYEALGYEHTGRRYAKPLSQGQSLDRDNPC